MADLSVLKLPDNTTYDIKDATARSGLADKQDTLVSGTNIKTINSTSLLGSGNIDILSTVYPVGSIYMSVSSTNPGSLFGGTWEQIKDTFLLSAGDTYTAGSTGGAASGTTSGNSDNTSSVAISSNQMPSHSHPEHAHGSSGGSGWANTWKGDNKTAGNPYTGSAGGGQGHTHTLNNHTHTVDTLPPYLTVYMWERTA